MDLQILWDALLALVPPTLVGGLFYVIMRGILRADSTERKVYARMEAEMRAEREAKTVQKAPKKSASSAQKVTKSTKKTSL
jgi:GrpB-like predicted nucleotidyltransferase (UPF0157 family)